MEEKEFKDLLKQHNEALASIEKASALVLNDKQKKAFEIFKEDFIDALDVDENGNITMSSKNILKLNSLDEQFEKLAKNFNKTMVSTLANNVSKIVESNVKYFSGLDGDAKLLPIIPKVKNAISGWLGISEGKVAKNGFIDQLVESDSAKIAIKNLAMKIVIGQQGKAKAKEELQTLIEGNPKTLGAFEKHYKTFANDLNSQIDRATSNVIRTDLKLEFAIYVGGLIETSRIFCEEHTGKIYHISEILQFDPKVGIPPNYEPISDLGGYNCRHHLRWISKAMAKAMGKDVSKYEDEPIKPEVKEKPAKEPAKKEEVVPKTEDKPIPTPKAFDRIPMKQDFDKIETIKIESIPFPKEWDIYKDNFKVINDLKTEIQSLGKKMFELKNLIKQQKDFTSEKIKDYNNLVKEFNSNVRKRNDYLNEFEKVGRKEFDRILKNIKTENSDLKLTIINNYKNDSINDAFQIFKKISSKYEIRNDFSLEFIRGRANYSSTGNRLKIQTNEKLDVIIHEFAHSLENNDYVLKQAVDFLNRRTEKSKVLKLRTISKAYNSKEEYKKGGFFNPYVGKIYKNYSPTTKNYKGIVATEIISMGLEEMFRNPIKFKIQDPEHYDLIYNLFFK